MKYKYYGTAAAEAIPSLFCDCQTCQRARKIGGRNVMSRSQQTIDNKLLIDFPSDTFYHTTMGLPLNKIRTCIITHNHEDHFYVDDFMMRCGCGSHPDDEEPFTVYVTKAGYNQLKKKMSEHAWYAETPDRVKAVEIKPFVPFTAEGYKITPLKANHGPQTDPVIYLIEKDGKCVLHSNDTGYYPDETWEYLEKLDVHIDFASFDCTEAYLEKDDDRRGNHCNYPTIKNIKNRLAQIGLVDETTISVVNHFSHNCGLLYDDLCSLVKDDGFLVSYDGFEIEF